MSSEDFNKNITNDKQDGDMPINNSSIRSKATFLDVSPDNKESDSIDNQPQLQMQNPIEQQVLSSNTIPVEYQRESLVREVLSDPRIPYTLALYLQLISNAVLTSIIFYLIYIFITTIRIDINQRMQSTALEILQEISFCSREYVRNRCSPESGLRVPALEQECTELDKCRNRDPQLIARSKITAETFAEIVNGFIGKISWKSIILINILIFGGLIVSNVAFGNYRTHSAPFSSKEDQEKINQLEKKVREQELIIRNYENGDQRQVT
ncbi:uncharacterized protein SPAPADRAFT_51742 [Spathaspora passalidarum NRRL Y-27907]|uniref:Brl1/Brr6 domain-containing protein n=1 Tax=Spathaspora passalidarum (strain NRRL Y-27907 / 11-Y1) TaxID=619300 RepID=G3ARK9_SPAPN|nr:uncharacterized protein SPAPADRAFT_51742 [Spathaspora passalidarum NRRL Y-27907]EGW31762.1 hypothetical protein SPAPADRAFT_51742 [Spathaspora passalidarum NRRL Y-27907]